MRVRSNSMQLIAITDTFRFEYANNTLNGAEAQRVLFGLPQGEGKIGESCLRSSLKKENTKVKKKKQGTPPVYRGSYWLSMDSTKNVMTEYQYVSLFTSSLKENNFGPDISPSPFNEVCALDMPLEKGLANRADIHEPL